MFSAAESRRVLEAGKEHGLRPRLHADEFVDSGGAELAAELGALSADHLMAVSPAGIEALALAGVTAVLLPGTSFFLMKTNYAPARRLIEAGVPVALGTDCNPGSSHTESMPMVMVLAVLQLGLTIEEALTAATLNAACSLGLGEEIGSIEVGKRADLVLLDSPERAASGLPLRHQPGRRGGEERPGRTPRSGILKRYSRSAKRGASRFVAAMKRAGG